jgi:alpha-N-arabinofuranosidase
VPKPRSRPATYRNPIIAGFHPDPSICRLGEDFYLVTSSFEYFPGVPIFHSRDLVHWQQLGHVLTRRSQLDLRRMRSSGGIYAPTLRYHRGRYYLVTTNVEGGGNFYVTATQPGGPWSDPVWLDAQGIDPSLFFEGATVYYTRNGPGRDFDHPLIYQGLLDVQNGRLRGKLRPIWSGTGGIWPEAPHLFKVGTTYYLLTAEGGTSYGHSVVIARSSSPFGPFDGHPNNPILTHRSRRNHPIQATGHADLVALADGTWWAVCLGIRPTSGRHHHLGRETFLAPVTWNRDGWPVVGSGGRVELEMVAPPLRASRPQPPPARDDFDSRRLAPVWNFLRNPHARDWSLGERPGWLRLRGSAVALDDVDSPAFVARRQQHHRVRCRAALDFTPERADEEAGLTVRANEDFHYDLVVRRAPSGRQAVLRSRNRGKTRVVGALGLGKGRLLLEIEADEARYVFRAGVVDRTEPLGRLSTRTLSAESVAAFGQNCFTGVYLGMYATGNGRRSTVPADFDWFEYLPLG